MGNKVRRKNRQESLLQEDKENTRIKTEMVQHMILATNIVLKEMDMAQDVLYNFYNLERGYNIVCGDVSCSGIRSKHIKDSKVRLFIRTQTHSLQIFGAIPFVKRLNDT